MARGPEAATVSWASPSPQPVVLHPPGVGTCAGCPMPRPSAQRRPMEEPGGLGPADLLKLLLPVPVLRPCRGRGRPQLEGKTAALGLSEPCSCSRVWTSSVGGGPSRALLPPMGRPWPPAETLSSAQLFGAPAAPRPGAAADAQDSDLVPSVALAAALALLFLLLSSWLVWGRCLQGGAAPDTEAPQTSPLQAARGLLASTLLLQPPRAHIRLTLLLCGLQMTILGAANKAGDPWVFVG
ncbi:uncharacterized protein LOC129400866 [Sorex araneus]|uniref:uncharacterized protein LOC129400866 n=1 Tax=Sorex araneus TaxID=42254 RepID=UPI0024337345|nr:uncharacterized protein LOC129400866 [Sorex araneus]